MSRTDPTLELKLESPVAEVGSLFRGQLVRTGELNDMTESSSQPVRAVRLRLHWFTEGRGDTDRATVQQNEFPVDQYGRLNTTFQLAIPPPGPISYDGALMRVMWELEARTDVKFRTDRYLKIPVLVVPLNGFGLYHRPHPLR